MTGLKILSSVAIAACFAAFTATPATAEDSAVIKGKVVFKGDPAAYKRIKLDTSKDPNCALSKAKIGSWKVILNKKTDPTTIRNVLVYVKEGLDGAKYDPPGEPVVLDQIGCEYKPHVLGIIEGQELLIRNSDNTNHNIHFLPKINAGTNRSQPQKGMENTVKLVKEAPFKVKCDVHPWMGCHIAVFDHPFFDVTGKKGTFELKGLPSGKYVVEAWHETFGTQTLTAEVTAGQTSEVEFTFQPEK